MENKLSGRGLVIRVSNGLLSVCAVRLGKYPVKAKGRYTAQLPEGAAADGAILKPEAVSEELKRLMRENRLRGYRRAVFCLCSTQVLSETAVIPNVERKWLGKMIETNRDLYFPVNTGDYRVTYTEMETVKDEDGKPAFSVRLWAAPNELLKGYYELANSCGLSVAAVDYCGNSFTTAAGATYRAGAQAGKAKMKAGITLTRSRGKSGTETAAETAEGTVETRLCLLNERDFLLLSFIQGNRVVMQRYLRRDGVYMGELEETRLAVALFSTSDLARGGRIRAVLAGEMAADPEYARRLESALGVDVEISEERENTQWLLMDGAAATTLDFGDPAFDKPKRFSFFSQAWQYLAILAGGAVLTSSILAYLAPIPVREAEISNLEVTQRTKEHELQGVNEYKSSYDAYTGEYTRYLLDWQAVLGWYEDTYDDEGNVNGKIYHPGLLRTYNDNLGLILGDLEQVIPKTSSVTEIRIEERAMAIQFASERKEDVANLLLALRYNLTYAAMYPDFITSMTQGGGVSVFDDTVSAAIQMALGAGEAPPTEGSAPPDIGEYVPEDVDTEALKEVLATLPEDQQEFVRAMIDKGPDGSFSDEELQRAYEIGMGLNEQQRRVIAQALGYDPEYGYALSQILPDATMEQRRSGMEALLHNPMALCLYGQMMIEDFTSEKSITRELLISQILFYEKGVTDSLISAFNDPSHMSPEEMKTVFSILTSFPLREDDNGQNLNATIALIQTSGEMSDYYAYYLAVAMGLPDLGVENPSAPQTDPVVPPAPDAPETPENPEDPNNPESPQTPTEEPRLTILKALLERQFGIPAEALDRIDWDKINLNELDLSDPAKAAQTLYNEVMEQLFGEFPDVPDIPDVPDVPVVPEEPPDMRYFITVVLTYNENILTTELPREGMDPAGFVPELGLEPEAEVER